MNIPEKPEIPMELIKAYLDDKLVLFIGAGISRRVGANGWHQFADYFVRKLIESDELDFDHNTRRQIAGLDPKKKISIALELLKDKRSKVHIGEALNVIDYDTKERIKSKSIIYDYLNQLECKIITTNYDDFLEDKIKKENLVFDSDQAATKMDSSRQIMREEIVPGLLDQSTPLKIYLHGKADLKNHYTIEKLEDLIITTPQYLKQYRNTTEEENYIISFLRKLFGGDYTILFLGYGLEEMEILEHMLKNALPEDEREKSKEDKETPLKRYWLEGFYSGDEGLAKLLKKYYLTSFGLELVPYCLDKFDYEQIDKIIISWVKQVRTC